jgi:hypothetical protein
MGLTGQCAFANSRCKLTASADKEFCPRHSFLLGQFGVEGAHDVELGVEWRVIALKDRWGITATWMKEQKELAEATNAQRNQG